MPALTIDASTAKAAPFVPGPKVKRASRPTFDIPQSIIDEARKTERVPFNARDHVAFEPPKKIVTMKEIGLEGQGISPNAVSDPFPLFTQEAMKQMRAEAFSDAVQENCRRATELTPNLIRGMNHDRAPFSYAAWYSPEVLRHVSDVAGIDLVPLFDYDVANLNVAISNQHDHAISGDDQVSAVAWHHDSVPFVCVTMASDCTGMVGGETAIQLPNGDVQKIRGPTMGTAVVMQGRYIYHQALKAFGGRERIAMVTSFRPKSALVKDETTLNGLRALSDLSELYTQYTNYRLENLEERLRVKQNEERRRQVEGRPYEISKMREWICEQKSFLDAMLDEIIDTGEDS